MSDFIKTSRNDKPQNLPVGWDAVFSAISGSFWTYKGLSGTCPFCHAASDSGKMRFLIRFYGNKFSGYSCFICQTGGSGLRGVSKLSRQLGLNLSFFELTDMAGVDPTQLGGTASELTTLKPSGPSRLGDGNEAVGTGEPIDWPPHWIRDTDSVFLQGVEYIESRGIQNATQIIEKHNILFSEVVEVVYNGHQLIKPYRCLVVPMVGKDGEVVGWTTRAISKDNPNDPKSIAMSGAGWKVQSLFGIREIDNKKPVSIVEGLFSSLSTPNSVALGGKDPHEQQLDLLAETGARVFVFALDPGVDVSKFANAMYRLRHRTIGSTVLFVDWALYGVQKEQDPNDLGLKKMREIIADTVVRAMKSKQ